MRKILIAGMAIATSVAAASVSASEIDPALEQAIRNSASYVLHDPYSAVFTFDVVTEMGGGQAGKGAFHV